MAGVAKVESKAAKAVPSASGPDKYVFLMGSTAGVFTAITNHPCDNIDYHWEKRYVTTLEDMERVARTPRQTGPWDREAYLKALGRGLWANSRDC